MRIKPSLCPLLVAAFLTALLYGCGTKKTTETDKKAPPAGQKILTAAEIENLIIGNTLMMEEYGVKAEAEIYANGTMRGFKKGFQDQTKGWWSVENDKLCTKFSRWGAGDKRCYEVRKVGDEYRQYASSGLIVTYFTVVKGTAHEPYSGGRSTRKGRGRDRSSRNRGTVSTDQPDVKAAEETAPAIQETAIAPSYNPQRARRDLRSMYREMTRNCPGCNLPNIDLANASLIRANLAGANLQGANFNRANLKWANLKGANLVGADLTKANLAGADLAGADLERADLTGADLTRANLRGANIEGAIGIDLKGSIR